MSEENPKLANLPSSRPQRTQRFTPNRQNKRRADDPNQESFDHQRRPNPQLKRRRINQKYQRSNRNAAPSLGFFGSVPSLQDLHRENRKKSRRHYQQHKNYNHQNQQFIRHPTPQVPPSAPTPGRYLGTEVQALATPNTIKQPTDIGADKLQGEGLPADLDFYGTNEGLVVYNSGVFGSSDDNEHHDDGARGEMEGSISYHSLYSDDDYAVNDIEEGDDDHAHDHHQRLRRVDPVLSTRSGAAGGSYQPGEGIDAVATATGFHKQSKIMNRLRKRISEDAIYIAELEDENLKLREQLDFARWQMTDVLNNVHQLKGGEKIEKHQVSDVVADAVHPNIDVVEQQEEAVKKNKDSVVIDNTNNDTSI